MTGAQYPYTGFSMAGRSIRPRMLFRESFTHAGAVLMGPYTCVQFTRSLERLPWYWRPMVALSCSFPYEAEVPNI